MVASHESILRREFGQVVKSALLRILLLGAPLPPSGWCSWCSQQSLVYFLVVAVHSCSE